MQDTALVLSVGAGTVLLLGVTSGWVKNRLWVSEPAICLLIGVLIGPAVLDLFQFDPLQKQEGKILKEVARVTLAISIIGVTMRLPRGYVATHWRQLATVLLLGMPLMWMSATALVWLLLPVPLLVAAVAGAVMAPVDPVLSDAVVNGRVADEAVPSRLTDSLSAEGAANDGLGLLFVMLPVLLLSGSPNAWLEWFGVVLLWEICLAVIIGAAAGWLAGRLALWASRQPLHEPVSLLTIAVALALTVLASLRLIHSDGILGVFAAGVVLNRYVTQIELPQHEHIPEAISRFFDLPVFILLGVALPWQAWANLGWPAYVLPVLVLLLRRMPAWLALRRILPSLESRKDALFNGWFAPVGIATVFYALVVHDKMANALIWPVTSAVVAASVLVHGISATPLARAYGRSGN